MIVNQHVGLASGPIFPGKSGGLMDRSGLRRALATAQVAACIPTRVTPQVLRRTYNTLMVRAGVDRAVLRDQIGHCSETMTRHYLHVSAQDKRSAVQALYEEGV